MTEENEVKIVAALEAILAVQKEILAAILKTQIDTAEVRRSLS